MEIIWDRGEVTVSEVRESLSKKREVARNTVQTMMVRLEERGWLKHREDRRAFIYSAARPRVASLGAKPVHGHSPLFFFFMSSHHSLLPTAGEQAATATANRMAMDPAIRFLIGIFFTPYKWSWVGGLPQMMRTRPTGWSPPQLTGERPIG